jgi:hypothetical protein
MGPVRDGTSMKISRAAVLAPRGLVIAMPNSLADCIAASRAEVARHSASSAPVMPLVGISRAGCQFLSLPVTVRLPVLLDVTSSSN